MKRSPKILTRFLLLGGLGLGGYFLVNRLSPSLTNQSSPLTNLLGSLPSQIQGVSDSLNLDTTALLKGANEKLVQRQPIIDTSPSVKGDSVTTDIASSAQTLVQDAVQKLSVEIKNLPKQEAAKILRQTCDQLVSELEK